MKIRTDFVTNSSSSNYCVEITVVDKKGKRYRLVDDGYDFSPDDGGLVEFNGDIREVLKFSDSDDIAALCQFLTESLWDPTEDDYEYYEEHIEYMKEQKQEFTNDIVENVKSVENISQIILERTNSAWGEGNDNLYDALSDDLYALAKKAVKSSGEEREQAVAEIENRYLSKSESSDYDWDGDAGKRAQQIIENEISGLFGSVTDRTTVDMKTRKTEHERTSALNWS